MQVALYESLLIRYLFFCQYFITDYSSRQSSVSGTPKTHPGGNHVARPPESRLTKNTASHQQTGSGQLIAQNSELNPDESPPSVFEVS